MKYGLKSGDFPLNLTYIANHSYWYVFNWSAIEAALEGRIPLTKLLGFNPLIIVYLYVLKGLFVYILYMFYKGAFFATASLVYHCNCKAKREEKSQPFYV